MAKEWWEDAPLAPQADSDAGDWWQEAPLESETKPKARTWGEAAKDGASSFGASVNNTLKTLTDLAGTNNSASEFLEENAKTWQGNYSPVYKAELQKQASEKAALGDDPSYAARAGLMAKQVVRNPVEGVGELAGNIAPLVVGVVAGMGVKGMAALSAAMGAGAVKGGIAETVKNAPDADLMPDPLYTEMRNSGISEEGAKAALSEQRASYGDAYGKILLGAGIGAAVGRFGSVENAIANMGKRTAAQAQTGLLKGVGTGVAKEVVTEIPQEMTETYLGNKGASDQGASIAADQGVVESGVKAGILSAVGGGVAGMTGRGAIQPVPQATPADIMDPSVTSVDQAIAISQAALSAGRQFQELGLTQPVNDLAMQRQISSAQENLAARARLQAEEQAEIIQAQSERDGAAASQARDQRLSEAGQAWQDLGIADPADDLQAQRIGMRGNQDDRRNPDLQSLPTGSPGRGSAEPGVGLETALGRDGAAGQRLGAGLPGTVSSGESVAPADGSNADAVGPAKTWFGRKGDGYVTEGDAVMALPSRQKIEPDLNWRVEAMPSGKFRLAGYADAAVKSDDAANIDSIVNSQNATAIPDAGGAKPVRISGTPSDDRGDAWLVQDRPDASASHFFDSTPNPTGTLIVHGDPAEIRAAGINGVAQFKDGKPTGILVSVSNAPKVEAQLEAARVQNQTPRSDAAPAQARAQAPAVGAATGQAAEPVAGSGAVQAVNQPQGTLNGTQAAQAQQIESSAPAHAASDPRLIPVSQRTPKPIDPRLIPKSTRAIDPEHIGADSVPLFQGGKPFKTKIDANTARKNQPMMRVVKSGKGFALAPKTEKQIAAQEKAAKRLSIARTGRPGVPIAVHEFIAGEGGLNPVMRSDLGVEKNPRVGNRSLYARGGSGMTLEQATQRLLEEGHLPQGQSQNEALALIKRSLTQPQYTPEGFERMAQAEADTRFEDRLAAQEEAAQNEDFDPFASMAQDGFTPSDIELTGYDELQDPIKLEVNALLALAEGKGIDVDSIKEQAHEDTRNGSEQDYYEASRAALTAAIEGGRRGGSQDTGQPGDTGEQAGLTSPTRADVLAQQDRADNAQALDDKAQIDAEASLQTLTRQAAPEQRTDTSGDMFAMEKAQAEIYKRNAGAAKDADPNQGSIFDAPAEPAKPASEMSASELLRAAADKMDAEKSAAKAERIEDGGQKINAAFDTLADTIQTKEDDAGNVAMFSRADSIDVSDQRTGISSILLELGKLNSLYQYPRSSKSSLKDIAADKGITISDVDRNTEDGKLWMIANTTPTDAPGVKSWIVTLPGGKHATLTDKNGEVYINVSAVGEGQGGSRVYDLAANYAFNNGLKFIGDPNGVSPAAMRRRLENMLSAAIKYGSTDFLAPHADQVEGRPDIGVPALRWTEGDTLGNIRSMVDVSVASTKSTNPAATQDVRFDPATHTLRDGGDHVVDARRLSEVLEDEGRTRGTGQAGNTTLRRNALFNSLLQSVGNRAATMEFIHRQQDRGGSGIGGALEGSFYSHAAVRNPSTVERVQSAVAELIGGKQLPNQLGRVVATTAAEIKSHWEALIDKSVNIGSEGDAGVAQAFYDPRSKTVFLIADHISQGNEAAVLAHELMHKHGQAVLGKEGWARLHGVISSWEHAPADSEEHAVYSYARNKVAAVGEHLSSQEMLPYCVEAALKMGIQPSMAAKKGTVARWLESVRQNMRMVWGKITGKPESFRTQDLVDLAFGIAQRENPAHAGISLEAGGEPTAPDGGGAMFSRTGIVGQTSRQHTPEQLRAMANVGFQVEVPTLKERAQALWKDAGKKMAQGIVDQFAPVKALDGTAYGLLRLAKGASGAFEAFLHGGKLKLTDGVYDFDETNKGGVIDKLLIPLQGEHHDFMRWVAANRAERLQSEGKENLFSTQDIADLKTLASGTAGFDYTVQTGPGAGRVTRDRTLIYADSLRVFNAFNKNILDMAEQSGLIDGAIRQVWEHEFYVPFYRVADEDGGGVRGMNIKGSVVRQQAFKELKGGKNALNADLLDNTLMNWAHLLDASAKNRAAKATIEAAEAMGVATGGNQSTLAQMGASVNNKNGVVWFMDGGQKRYSLIDKAGDGPYLMTALGALEYSGMRNPVMNAMSAMKYALTIGVTASPFFKIRNLIRDSVQVLGTSRINPNPLVNVAKGWSLTDPKSDAYFRLLAGGGTIHFGSMMEGSEAKRVQSLVESGVKDATLLNSEHKVKAFYRRYIEPGITAYNELGNRGEAINRASLYDQLVQGGMSHADASLQARDLMDFSMQGSFTSIRFLTQVVPFFNARLQGMYKLGRAAKEDPARFSAVVGATAMFSIALLAAYSDDDDWKKREEWDRNNFWWFKFGGTAFRIPKPFEIGAIATLAERGFELAFDKEMTGSRFGKQVATLLGDNLSMNPVPQLVKPIVDVYANKNSFSGRPIETMSMERLKSEYRFTDRTSMTARGLSTAANSVAGLVGGEAWSPVQIDHMLRGYFGWLGSFVVGAGDVIARPATGQTSRAASDMWKVATGGMVSELRDAPSRYVSQMYEQAREIEQAYGTWRSLQKEGKTLEAQEFFKDNREDLSKYRRIEAVKKQESKLNERIRIIERSDMDGDAKRDLIRSIQVQKDRVARQIAA